MIPTIRPPVVIPVVGDVLRIHSYEYETFYGVRDTVKTRTYVHITHATDVYGQGWHFRAKLCLGHRNPDEGRTVFLTQADLDEAQHRPRPVSIKDEHARTVEKFISKMNGQPSAHDVAGRLLHLFNVRMVDFVRQDKAGAFIPVDFPKKATHRLEPTAWEDPRTEKTDKHRDRFRGDPNTATAVCAIPMHRKHVLRGPAVHATRALPAPRLRPVYDAQGSVVSRRIVLLWMIKAMRAKVHQRFVKKASEGQCDLLYRNLMVAHNQLDTR